MNTKTFHFADVNKSKRLQDLREVLMDADRPMTPNDIYESAKLRGITLSISAIPTSIGELGKNEGYEVSDGTDYGQSPGPAVKFPDGKYRYWLKRAPGWVQRWYVSTDFRVVQRSAAGELTHVKETIEETMKSLCLACGKEIAPGGAPWCDDACNTVWKQRTFGN